MIIENYTMIMAGRERTFKQVKFKKSKFTGNNIISHKELKRLHLLLAEELSKMPEMCLSQEEKDFLNRIKVYDKKD